MLNDSLLFNLSEIALQRPEGLSPIGETIYNRFEENYEDLNLITMALQRLTADKETEHVLRSESVAKEFGKRFDYLKTAGFVASDADEENRAVAQKMASTDIRFALKQDDLLPNEQYIEAMANVTAINSASGDTRTVTPTNTGATTQKQLHTSPGDEQLERLEASRAKIFQLNDKPIADSKIASHFDVSDASKLMAA